MREELNGHVTFLRQPDGTNFCVALIHAKIIAGPAQAQASGTGGCSVSRTSPAHPGSAGVLRQQEVFDQIGSQEDRRGAQGLPVKTDLIGSVHFVTQK